MPLLLCARCHVPIAALPAADLPRLGESLCERCSHPAYYRGRPPYARAPRPA